jgi:hypothetical protein
MGVFAAWHFVFIDSSGSYISRMTFHDKMLFKLLKVLYKLVTDCFSS